MAGADELLEGLADYQQRSNGNPKLRKMLRAWSRTVHFVAVDAGVTLTAVVEAGEMTRIAVGAEGAPDVVIEATSEDLADMFWGDLNPAAKYLSGEIKVQGSQDDVMRIDAMASLMWVDG
jgi:putative sterol carrier protein